MSQNKKTGIIITAGLLMILAVLFGFDFKKDVSEGIAQGINEENVLSEKENNKRELKIIFFDIGQGDAIFIETPNKKQILIDGGDDQQILKKLQKEMGIIDRYIDIVILTHPHADHVNGLKEVLKRYEVGEVWLSGVSHTLGQYLEFLDLIKTKDIATKIIYTCGQMQGEGCLDKIEVEDGIIFKILSPLENLTGVKVDNLNNSSLVLKLIYENNSWLLAGDLETDQEKLILDSFESRDLQAQVLKDGHHGSTTSSSQEFLEAVTPNQAIISVGVDNSFGHPSLRVLNRLERNNIEIWRTDEEGDITTIGDGEEIEIFSEK